MKPRKPEPATTAFEALALAALRRTSRESDEPKAPGAPNREVGDDTVTELYLRATAPAARKPRPHAAVLQTMTVRAVAALGEALASPRQAPRPRRAVRMPAASARSSPSRRSRLRTALVAGALAACGAALLTAALIARQPSPASRPTPDPQLNRTALSEPPAKQIEPSPAAAPPLEHSPEPPLRPQRAPRGTRATPASAADALASGDYALALASYRELAMRNPERPAFAAITHILDRDLTRSCDPTSTPPGTPCLH